jgi:hypothetical protein
MSDVMRSGRIDIERLRKLSPRFVERYQRERGEGAIRALRPLRLINDGRPRPLLGDLRT